MSGPSSPALGKTLVVATTARSGSTLLCATLREVGGFGNPDEYLNLMRSDFDAVPGKVSRASSEDVSVRMRRWLEGDFRDEGVDAIKLMWTNFADWRTLHPEALPAKLREARWIFLRRRDKIAQAVSLTRAKQTGQWHFESRDEETRDADYLDFYSQAGCLAFIKRQEESWERFFARENIDPEHVWYEDFCVSPRYFVNRWRTAWNLPRLEQVDLSEIPVRKVSNADSREWRTLLDCCLEHNLLEEGDATEHFLACGFPLWLEAKILEEDAESLRIGFSVTNHGDQVMRGDRELWGETSRVFVTMQWARRDQVSAKHLDGKVELPELFAPGQRFEGEIRVRYPEEPGAWDGYLLFAMKRRSYDIRLMRSNVVQLVEAVASV